MILALGTARTERLTTPLCTSNTPPTTEYFLTCHWATATTMTSANRNALTHHGAPPKMVSMRNGIAWRTVLAVPMIR